MNVQTFKENNVMIGYCERCREKRVVIDYEGDCYCTRCIENDDHLSSIIGWHRY